MTRSMQTKQCGRSLDPSSDDSEDKVRELPEDIILSIVEKIRDTKTLVLCSVVSKQLHAVVSKIDTISVRILPYPRFRGRFACSESHNHFPPSQVRGLMRVFGNVKHLNIRLCTFPTLSPGNQANHLLLIKAMINGDDIRIDCCSAIKVGLLRRGKVEMMEMLFDPMLGQHPISYANDVCIDAIVRHRPRTLSSIVISFVKMHGFYRKKVSMTRKMRDLCKGKLFMTRKQLDDVTNLPPNTSVEGWLQDARNFAYQLKNSVNNGRPRDELWHVTQWESFCTEMGKIYVQNPTVSEMFVKELLGVAKDDDCDEKRRTVRFDRFALLLVL
ncbi:hypothetical protein SADUNF_Sadunf03G0156400 [Salix dunnii]|uniref:F-box domain-containing protein n=1 Tax=Salix dunnii TaxID=1413687 RepID=A0A835TGX5_9ROSI|nr:hypothetical protein SADUNF_Sadunf03G0156400 [Salix dunnii]